MGAQSKEWAEALWIMCRRDPLYWLNVFGWTYNPKQHPRCPIRPFITWPFQDKAFGEMFGALGVEDVAIKKSRDMGASWMGMMVFTHTWLFDDNQAMGVMSRRAEEVDSSSNPKSLFWKIDFMLRRMPGWLRPEYTRTEMHLFNELTESSIDGETTTPDAFVGDRRLALWLDEFAVQKDGKRVDEATADVTNCRMMATTSRGTGTHFYRVWQNPHVKKIWLPWSDHPEKAAGLYVADRDSVRFLDTKYSFGVEYPFVRDGKKRSPWYDRESLRRSSKLGMSQEVDGDDLAAGGQWFDPDTLKRILAEDVCEPYMVGEVVQRDGKFEAFTKLAGGHLKLWKPLGPDGRPQRYTYVFGTDWSAGSGASNSSTAIGCVELREQVGEYTRSDLGPERYAEFVVALAEWFWDAQVAPERNGPGSIGIKRMQDLGFTKFYYARKEESDSKRETDTPGWMPTNPNKEYLLGLYRSALGGRRWTVRSEPSIIEAQEYVRDSAGFPVHSSVLYEDDPAGAKSQHGDRVIGSALCYLLAHDSVVVEEQEDEERMDLTTLGGRRKWHEQRKQLANVDELGSQWRD